MVHRFISFATVFSLEIRLLEDWDNSLGDKMSQKFKDLATMMRQQVNIEQQDETQLPIKVRSVISTRHSWYKMNHFADTEGIFWKFWIERRWNNIYEVTHFLQTSIKIRPVARKILQPRHYFQRCARIEFYKLLAQHHADSKVVV